MRNTPEPSDLNSMVELRTWVGGPSDSFSPCINVKAHSIPYALLTTTAVTGTNCCHQLIIIKMGMAGFLLIDCGQHPSQLPT